MLKTVDALALDSLLDQAASSPRKRAHQLLHTGPEDTTQRLCIALAKGTYVRPHHHPRNNTWEMLIALRGRMRLVLFDNEGTVTDTHVLSPDGDLTAIELPTGTWHTLIALSERAAFMELKPGPYTPAQNDDFAAWAPAEGDPEAKTFLDNARGAQVGEQLG